jgi:phosphoserine phosphatase
MRHANKMYLQGVASDAGMPAPAFLRQALDQVAWHARQGHLIVMASGTLEPLARHAAERLEQELARRGIGSAVRVFATCLEQRSGTWTGRIAGKARIGEEKAEALRVLAAELNLDLARCYGYGDTASDAPMLAMVGRPATVNASQDLQNIARREGWAEISWDREQSRAAEGAEVRSGGNRDGPAAAGRRA